MESIFEHVEPTGFCWLWAGGQNNCGYGQIKFKGKTQPAHRVVYTILVGDIPKGLQLDHLCHVRLCVNPDHLEPVTKSENMRRAGKRNGWVEGGKKPERKPRSEWKLRANLATSTHCKRNHVLSEVGIYEHTTPNGQVVRACLSCKKIAQCKANHTKTGCTPACPLQTYPR